MRYITTFEDREVLVDILDDHLVSVDDVLYEIDFEQVGDQPVFSLIVNGQSHDGMVYQEDDRWQVLLQGKLYSAFVEDEREKRLRAALGGIPIESEEFFLKAPMPGLVVSVPVTAGQPVEKGDVLLILESMKMQNELKAPRAGRVERLRVKPGDRVEKKETLLSVV